MGSCALAISSLRDGCHFWHGGLLGVGARRMIKAGVGDRLDLSDSTYGAVDALLGVGCGIANFDPAQLMLCATSP